MKTLISNLIKHTDLNMIPTCDHVDFIECYEIAHHATTMDYTSLCDLVDRKIAAWLKCDAWVAGLNKEEQVKENILSFSWDFEEVGDRVVTNTTVALNGSMLNDEAFLNELADIKIDNGIPAARAYAKRYAKAKGYTFINEESDTYGYRSALMQCANRNK